MTEAPDRERSRGVDSGNAAEAWRDEGGSSETLRARERAYAAMLTKRDAHLMTGVRQKQHAELLFKVADAWKKRFPLRTKIAIGAILGAAGIAGFAYPAIAGVVGLAALAWKAGSVAMAGLATGLATFTYAKKRNYNDKIARRAGLLAASIGGLVSFFGGRMLEGYFAEKLSSGAIPASEDAAQPQSAQMPHASPDRLVAMDAPVNPNLRFYDFLSQELHGDAGAMSELGLSDGAKTQLDHLINEVLSQRKDFAQQFFGITRDTPDGMREAFVKMIDKAGKEGIRFPFDGAVNMRVLGSQEFLDQLRTTLPNYRTHLGAELKEKGGVDALLDVFRRKFPQYL